MAKDNKTLGRFQLTDIPPAPRGVPQIEVTFDIDENGIVHVSAKDKGTGNEQNITIKSSSGLSDDEIDDMVKKAEAHAEEDEKRVERVETKNEADALVHQTEKTLKDAGDKVDQSIRDKVEKAKDELKDAIEEDDIELIKDKIENLRNELTELSSQLYAQAQQEAQQQQAGAQQAGGEQQTDNANDDTVDVDYEEVDDDE